MIALFAGLGIAMEPKWSVKPLSMHLQVTERSTAIKARGITTPQEGTYQVRQTRLRLPISGGKTVNAILREPEHAPGGRAACVFVHGAGTGKAEEVYADLANALASAGITTLVQDKRLDNYTPLHRDYNSSAEDYLAGLNLLRTQQGVDARKVGLYAESEGTWIASVMTHKDRHIALGAHERARVLRSPADGDGGHRIPEHHRRAGMASSTSSRACSVSTSRRSA